jgi:hypothetical protein
MPLKKGDIDLLQGIKNDISIPRCAQRKGKGVSAFLDRRNYEADVMEPNAIGWRTNFAGFSAQVNSPPREPCALLRLLTAFLLQD